MNPLTNVRNITKLNEREIELGIEMKNSWHNMYRESAWIFIGGLNYDLSEGDVISVFSQYGEVVNINLVRDSTTGKSKGFCFLCYEDQRSTVLAVDNLNAIKLLNRTIRVDHVSNYKLPKQDQNIDEITKKLYEEGCAPIATNLNSPNIKKETLKASHSRESSITTTESSSRSSSTSSTSTSTSSSSSTSTSSSSPQKHKRKSRRKESFKRVKQERSPKPTHKKNIDSKYQLKRYDSKHSRHK